MSVIKKSSRGRMPNGEANPIDIHVGERIRLRRQLLGLSQEKLAFRLGLTFQQVQKYERGKNRVGASRLWDIAKVLEVPVNFFYEEIDEKTANQSPRTLNGELGVAIEDFEVKDTDPMHRKEAIKLVKAYYRMPYRKAAELLFGMAEEMAKSYFERENNNPYNWLSYPENRPSDEQQYQDFAVLYRNPRRIKKVGNNSNIPKFLPTVMTWTGRDWLDLEFPSREITHFYPLPAQLKE